MMDRSGKRVLIFIVAYNAETTIEKVLQRIPQEIFAYDYEILIIDDQSADRTFDLALEYKRRNPHRNITVLYNPDNQGYGGNQKIGYQYAIDNGFDVVALLHGDGQYAPERLETLIRPVYNGEADAVFGTRMTGASALKGGMPLYKFVGNKILTFVQNQVLKMHLSEFHSGYRVYSVAALRGLPFQYNTNDFHFDTEIIIQLRIKGCRIREIPIPTYYGNEICHVNGMAYAWNVLKVTVGAQLHRMSIFYKRQFDIYRSEERYPFKAGYTSSHTMTIDRIPAGSSVLDVGCGQGYVGRELEKKGCDVQGVDSVSPDLGEPLILKFTPVDLSAEDVPYPAEDYDYVLLLDVIEHLDQPEQYRLMDQLRNSAVRKKPTVILTTPNIAFIVIRLLLLMGQFNYGRRGILDLTHRHLFTIRSLRRFLTQAGYKVTGLWGVPAPFPLALGDNFLSRLLVRVNRLLIKVLPGLFSYQIFAEAVPLSTMQQLLRFAQSKSEALSRAS